MRRGARALTAASLVAMLAAASGCRDAAAPCATPSRFAGSWRYDATQTSPVAATVSGTLVLRTAECGSVSGSVDAIERDPDGVSSRVAGDVDGRELDSTSLTFDLYLGSSARQHLARLRGDSLVGTWLDATPGGASGDFVARR